MKSGKLIQRTLLAIGLSSIISTNLLAETIDVSKANKDIKVMTRIIEASLESSEKSFPGRPRINGVYLAQQGYLFNIQLNGLGSFGIPGLVAWDGGRLEVDLPEIISEAFASIDSEEDSYAMDTYEEFATLAEHESNDMDRLYDNEELQDSLRELRESQREQRREIYQIRREIRRADDEEERAELEQKIAAKSQSLKKSSEDYKKQLNSYKTKRTQKQIKNTTLATDAIFSTICDYGQSLRALKKDEKFTLMVKGGVNNKGKKATQVFVIEQKKLKDCSDSKKLKSSAIHYNL